MTQVDGSRQVANERAQFINGVNFYITKYENAVANGNALYEGPMAAVTIKLTKDMIDNFGEFKYSKSSAAIVLDIIGHELVSNAVADVLITGACKGETRQAVFEKVKNLLSDMAVELELRNSSDKKIKKLANTLLNGAASANEVRHAIDALKDRTGLNVVDDEALFQLAQYLVLKLVDRSGMFVVVDVPYDEEDFDFGTHRTKMKAFQFNQKAIDQFKGLAKQISERSIGHEPLVHEPKAYTFENIMAGGYYTADFAVPAVKRSGHNYVEFKEYFELIEEKNDDRFLKAINEIQQTAFRINHDVLQLAKAVQAAKGGMLGMASTVPAKAKARMSKEDRIIAADEEEKRAGKARANKTTIAMADKYAKEEHIYFAYQTDFRGRLYNCCSSLNTQGDDLNKALLQFAKGKKLGENGYKWLCIHAANTYGGAESLDKASFADRVAFIENNHKLIYAVANGNIKRNEFRAAISNAENPFMFYAVCKELVQIMDKSDSERAEFISHLPVGMDGSCNGQQWAAGFLASLELAINVNLVKSSWTDKPADLYRAVADGMIEYFENNDTFIAEDAKASVEQVAELKDRFLKAEPNVQRKLCKRAVMTEAYAVTKIGQHEMMWVDVPKFRKSISKKSLGAYKNVYGKALDFGLAKACMASRTSMDFFKSCAKAMGDKVMYVTNPIGFVMKQGYKKEYTVTKQSTVAQKNLTVSYKIKSEDINSRRQASAIAPNVTHSHDSAHMLLTVLGMTGNDISWHLVHDDYGCHACDIDLMHKTIRKIFIEIHKQDRLEVLRQEIIAQGGDAKKIMANPRTNDFNLDDIKASTYFFA